MCPCLIDSWVLFELRHADANCKALIIECSCSQQQLPVQRSSCLVETSRIKKHCSSFLSHKQAKLSKSEVIADGKAHSAVFSLKDTDFVSLSECFRLFVCNLPRNVDIEEVKFVELFLDVALGINHEGSVIEFLIMSAWYGSDGVHPVLAALLLDGFKCGRVVEIFSEFMHVFLDIGGVANLAKHRHVCAVFTGSGESLCDVTDVLQLVGNAFGLQDCQLELLHKIYLKNHCFLSIQIVKLIMHRKRKDRFFHQLLYNINLNKRLNFFIIKTYNFDLSGSKKFCACFGLIFFRIYGEIEISFSIKTYRLFSKLNIPMLSPKKSLLKQSCEGLLECCNKQSHIQMLLHEDYQQSPSMERHDSKPSTEFSASSKQIFFREEFKKPLSLKISLSKRRNSKNVESFSKKQKESFSNFNQEIKQNRKMMSQINQNQHISPSSKKENLSIVIDEKSKKLKKSLRQQKQEKQTNNRPFLVQFSHMEDFCDTDGNLLHLDSKSIIQNLNKFNSSFVIDFKQIVPQHIQRKSLKLGSNLQTHRSQFNNTDTEFTKRSEVL